MVNNLETLKTYTAEQMEKLTRFDRASAFVTIVKKKEPQLEQGHTIVLFDVRTDRSLAVERQIAKILIGAAVGMFRELLDEDMGTEAKDIMNEKREFIDGDSKAA